jgi:hypothetical protein
MEGLDDDLDNIAQPSLAKRFAQEGINVLFFELDVIFGGLGHGREMICFGTWTF